MTPKVQQIPVPTLPNAPPPPPVIQNQPTGQKPGAKPGTSYLNAATSVPSKANIGKKTLIGQ